MIFRQETIQKKAKQIKKKKNKDDSNRVRNKILNFRVLPEEYEVINRMVEISGLNKQDYFISMLTNYEVIVYADYRTEDVSQRKYFNWQESLRSLENSMMISKKFCSIF